MKKFLLIILPILFLGQSLTCQITLKNTINGKQVKMDINERVKLTYNPYKSEIARNTQFLFSNSVKRIRAGKLVAYTDSTLTVKSGLFPKMHLIPIESIHSITSYNVAARYGVHIIFTSGAIVTMGLLASSYPIALVYGAGIVIVGGAVALDTFVLFPNKKVNNGEWILIVNDKEAIEGS